MLTKTEFRALKAGDFVYARINFRVRGAMITYPATRDNPTILLLYKQRSVFMEAEITRQGIVKVLPIARFNLPQVPVQPVALDR